MAASVHLRPFGRADFDRLIAGAESPEFLYQWAGPLFTYPLDRPQLERYLLTASGNLPTTRLFTALDESEAPAGQGYGRFVLGLMAFYDHRHAEARRYLEAFVRKTTGGRATTAIALGGEVCLARDVLGRI